jgi:hypothetical protein
MTSPNDQRETLIPGTNGKIRHLRPAGPIPDWRIRQLEPAQPLAAD